MVFEIDRVLKDDVQTVTNKTIDGDLNTLLNLPAGEILGTIAILQGGTGATTAANARTNLGAVAKAGDTMTGKLQFSGQTHAGLKLNALTTTERDALTAAAGDLIYNVTESTVQFYNGSTWQNANGGITYSLVEAPTGTINGVNVDFELSQLPITNSLSVRLNGLELSPDDHFTVTGTTVTLDEAPIVGDSIYCHYQYN